MTVVSYHYLQQMEFFQYEFDVKYSIKNLENKFTVANTYIKRIYNAAVNSKNTKQDSYYGERYSFLYQGNYSKI